MHGATIKIKPTEFMILCTSKQTYRLPSRPSSFFSSFDVSGLGFSTVSVLLATVVDGTGACAAGLTAGEVPATTLVPTTGFTAGTALPE